MNLSGIPYSSYSLYAYAGALKAVPAGGRCRSPWAHDLLGFADPVPSGYTQVTNTSSYTMGDYEVATGLTGGTKRDSKRLNGNGAINGFEIVNTGPAAATSCRQHAPDDRGRLHTRPQRLQPAGGLAVGLRRAHQQQHELASFSRWAAAATRPSTARSANSPAPRPWAWSRSARGR